MKAQKKYPASFQASLARLAAGPYFCKQQGSQNASLCFISGDHVIELKPARQMTFGAFAAAGLTIIDGVVSESAAVEAADHAAEEIIRGLAGICEYLAPSKIRAIIQAAEDFFDTTDQVPSDDYALCATIRKLKLKLIEFAEH